MKDNRVEAERISGELPKYNKLIINFENNGAEIKGLYNINERVNKGYTYDTFYKYIIKDYTEIKYRNIFIFSHGALLPDYGNPPIREQKFKFGEQYINQSTKELVDSLGNINNYFILMGTCQSNYFIDELENRSNTNGNVNPPNNIIALSVPTIGNNGAQITSLLYSLKFIDDYRNNNNMGDNLGEILDRLKSSQLINPDPNICPLGNFVTEFITRGLTDNITPGRNLDDEYGNNPQPILYVRYGPFISAMCTNYRDNTQKYIPLEDNYIELIDQANVDSPIETRGNVDLNFIKNNVRDFLDPDRNQRNGINNSKIYIGSNFNRADRVNIFCKTPGATPVAPLPATPSPGTATRPDR